MTDTQHQRDSDPGAMTTKHDSITTDFFGERVSVGQGGQASRRRAARQPRGTSPGWAEPEPIGLELEPAEPYPADCLGRLQPVLEVIQGRAGVSRPIAAASVLSSVALLAQSDYRTMTLGAEAPLGIFSYGLVSSGGRKTTSFRDSFTAHMEADELLVARHEAALDEYSRHNRLGDGEGGHYRIPRKSPPIALQMDITKAALIQELSQGRSAQCLASSDAGVVMSNRSGRGQQAVETVQTLTSLWDGQTHSLSRANITYRLSGRTLSVAWLAQPEFGEWLFSKRGELGLSSRFLVCSDDHWKAPAITDEEIDALVAAEAANQGIPPVDPVLQGFWGIISAVRAIQDEGLEYRPDASLAISEPPQSIGRTPEAYRLFLHFGRETGDRALRQENAHVRGFWRRAAEHACRLSAVMVAWERYEADALAATGTAGPTPPATIDEGAAQRAVTLVDWYGSELARITGPSGYTEVASQAHTLSRLLSKARTGEIVQNKRSGRGYLTSDGRLQVRTLIAQRMKGLSGDPDLQERVLKVLQRHEHIRMRGGTQCEVNPGLRELYSDG